MKIIKADIYGFGKWVDHSFHFAEESLICFYGENESGKTTLQQFIIYMLFGFPPRKRSAFKPRTSSKFGGRLLLLDDEIGEFVIERLDDHVTCYLADGTEQDGRWLKGKLNSMTEDMYRSIYSFSALDLSDIQEMKDESLGEILFSIGLTGATNIYTVERNINKKSGDLFKPTGRIPDINKQVVLLNKLTKKVREFERQERSYHGKIEEREDLISKLEDLNKRLIDLKKARYTYDKIRHLLPIIQDYQGYEAELESLPDDLTFPEKGIDRLNELKREIIPLQSELDLLRENEHSYRDTYDHISKQIQQKEQYDLALKLLRHKQEYLEEGQEFDLLKEKCDEELEYIDSMIADLNLDLTKEEIRELSFSFQLDTIWSDLSKIDDLLKLEEEQLLEEERMTLRKEEQLHDDKALLEGQLLSDEALQSLKTKLLQDDQLKGQMQNETARKHEWQKSKQKRKKQQKLILFTSMIIAVLSFISALINDSSLFYIIALVFLAGGLLQHYMTNRSLSDMEELMTFQSGQGNQAKELTEKERFQVEQAIEAYQAYKSELNMIDKSLRQLKIEQLQWEERHYLYEQKRAKHDEQLEEEKRHYPFLEKISVTHWLHILDLLKELKDKLNHYKDNLDKLNELKQSMANYEADIQHYFSQLDYEVSEETLDMIEVIVEEQRDLIRQKNQYAQFIDENVSKQNELNKRRTLYEGYMKELFDSAGAENEEEFFENYKLLERKNNILRQKATCAEQISLSFADEDKDLIMKESLNEADLELKISALNDEADELEAELDEKRDMLAAVDAELNQMESSDDFSELTYQIEIERQKLAELVFDWTVLQTAKTALEASKRAYRDKYLTEVIKKTARYFTLITNGKYVNVFPPTKSDPFLVQAKDHTRFDVQELSQGTVDQLYVSLRLAISEVMSERYNVPFIIDDAFVHFDMTRTKNIIDILLEIGKNQQVILFTCKEDIRQLVKDTQIVHINEDVSVH